MIIYDRDFKPVSINNEKVLKEPVTIMFKHDYTLLAKLKNLILKSNFTKEIFPIIIVYGKIGFMKTMLLKMISLILLKTSILWNPYPIALIFFDKKLLFKLRLFENDFSILLNALLENNVKVKTVQIDVKIKVSFYELIKYCFSLLQMSGYRPLKFGIVGASGILVNEGILWLLAENNILPIYYASPIAIELSILNNFVLNDLWTFKKFRGTPIVSRIVKYHLAVALGGVVNFIILLFLTYLGIYYLLANLIGIFCGYLVNYLMSELVVWTRKK